MAAFDPLRRSGPQVDCRKLVGLDARLSQHDNSAFAAELVIADRAGCPIFPLLPCLRDQDRIRDADAVQRKMAIVIARFQQADARCVGLATSKRRQENTQSQGDRCALDLDTMRVATALRNDSSPAKVAAIVSIRRF